MKLKQKIVQQNKAISADLTNKRLGFLRLAKNEIRCILRKKSSIMHKNGINRINTNFAYHINVSDCLASQKMQPNILVCQTTLPIFALWSFLFKRPQVRSS